MSNRIHEPCAYCKKWRRPDQEGSGIGWCSDYEIPRAWDAPATVLFIEDKKYRSSRNDWVMSYNQQKKGTE